MKQQLEKRLKELRVEFESGQKMLEDLESKQLNLRNALLRISGAIQVLEELNESLSDNEEITKQTGRYPEEPASQKY